MSLVCAKNFSFIAQGKGSPLGRSSCRRGPSSGTSRESLFMQESRLSPCTGRRSSSGTKRGSSPQAQRIPIFVQEEDIRKEQAELRVVQEESLFSVTKSLFFLHRTKIFSMPMRTMCFFLYEYSSFARRTLSSLTKPGSKMVCSCANEFFCSAHAASQCTRESYYSAGGGSACGAQG